MSEEPRTHKVVSRKYLLNDFFKVEELNVLHQNSNRTLSREQRWLVFDRGDSASVLLYNRDTDHAVVVRQFRPATLGNGLGLHFGPGDGWIVETIAGMVPSNETPEETVVRETQEETGYPITKGDLRQIATYFSSPGGASEKIFLYFAEVTGPHRAGATGGVDDEDVEILHVASAKLFEWLANNQIEDSKLALAALWLRDHLKLKTTEDPKRRSAPLPSTTIKYVMKSRRDLIIGCKTGPIKNVKGVDIWVNSENQDMVMDRFTGRTISATIRWLGAEKDLNDNATEDTIGNALSNAIKHVQHVRIGTVIETTAGALENNGVKRIYHVAAVKGEGPGQGFRADLGDVGRCVRNVLQWADRRNRHPWTVLKSSFSPRALNKSILFPMIGTGDGGLDVETVAEELIRSTIEFFQDRDTTNLKEIYFLSFTQRHKEACESALNARSDFLERLS